MTQKNKTPKEKQDIDTDRIACILIFIGELIGQINFGDPTKSAYYHFSDNALSGLSFICIDSGYDLLRLSENEV